MRRSLLVRSVCAVFTGHRKVSDGVWIHRDPCNISRWTGGCPSPTTH